MAYTTAQVYSLLGQIENNQNDGGYQTQILNNYQQLLDTVSKENNIINSTYNNEWTFNSAAGQQSKYIYQSSTILSKIYFYGFWIYLILGFILCIIIFMKPNAIYLKVLLIAVIILYPFIIYPLEEYIYIISTYIWDVLLSNTYDNGYGNTSIEYGLNGSSGSFGNNGSTVSMNGTKDSVIDGTENNSSSGQKNNYPPASTTTPIMTSTPLPLSEISLQPKPTTNEITNNTPISTPGQPSDFGATEESTTTAAAPRN
jgi:hypothetical protein